MLWFCIDNKSRLNSLTSKIDILNECYCKGFFNDSCGFWISWAMTWFFSFQLTDIPVIICTYPFVFDAQAKTTLLQTDAIIQMQVGGSVFNVANSLFFPWVGDLGVPAGWFNSLFLFGWLFGFLTRCNLSPIKIKDLVLISGYVHGRGFGITLKN